MATPRRASATSSTTRSKKAAAKALENTALVQSKGNVEELIRLRAYQLFEERGRRDGFDIDDWLRAEVEVTGAQAQSA
jgi:hypothetical protein